MAGTLQRAEAPPRAPASKSRPARRRPDRGVSARSVVLVLLFVAVLTAVPAVLAASRPSEFRSEVELRVPSPERARVEPPRDYVAAFVSGPILRGQLQTLLGGGVWSAYERRFERIAVRGGRRVDRGRVTIVVPGDTPGQARSVARLVAERVIEDAALKFPGRRRAEAGVARLERRLRAPGLEASRRRELRGRLAFARTAAQAYVPIVPLELSRPATRPADGWIARTVRPLIGRSLPGREPVWSGVAGLLLALGLIGAWLLLRGRPAA